MRIPVFIALMLVPLPAMAGEWQTAAVPGVLVPTTVEVSTRRDTITAGTFMDFAQDMIGAQTGAFSIGGQTITPTWASYWAANGERRVAVQLELVCGGREVAGLRIVRPPGADLDEKALMAAFDAQAGAAC